MIRRLRVEERRFGSGVARVVTFAADDVRPRSLNMPARLRAVEVAEQLCALYGGRFVTLALPPAQLRAASAAKSLRWTKEGEELLSLRSLFAYHAGNASEPERFMRSAPAELLELSRKIARRGLLAQAARGQGDSAAFVPVGSLGAPRRVGPFLRPAIVTNAHFFVILPGEVDSHHVPVGEAVGLTAASGVIGRPPTASRSVLLRARDGWRVEKIGLDRLVVVLPGGRELHGSSVGELYVRGQELPGGRTPRAPEAFEVTIVGRWPVGAAPGGGLRVPHAALVASLHSRRDSVEIAALRLGAPVTYRIAGVDDLEVALQAGPRLLAAGRIALEESSFAAEAFSSSGAGEPTIPTVFPADAGRTAAARLGVGVSASGELLVAAVEGESALHGRERAGEPGGDGRGSAGCTLLELAELLLGLGAREAVNLDGGGSVQVVVGSGALLRSADSRGVPGASYDRPVPTVASFT
ncbi:MAG: phosphodiester glycosidase family protein [Trueperaceae bacterium]